jgi:UDPglucose 6-dehydrogenase
VYDPKVVEERIYADLDYLNTRSEDENRALLTVENNPYEASKGSHAIAVLTEWEEFKTYDWQRIYDDMNKPAFVFDGRGILDIKSLQKIGFICYKIGSGSKL